MMKTTINNENNKDDIDNDNHINDDKLTMMNKGYTLKFDVPKYLGKFSSCSVLRYLNSLSFKTFIYLASPGFLAGMPQQHEPVTAVP